MALFGVSEKKPDLNLYRINTTWTIIMDFGWGGGVYSMHGNHNFKIGAIPSTMASVQVCEFWPFENFFQLMVDSLE